MNNIISKFSGEYIDAVIEALKGFSECKHLEDNTDLNTILKAGFYCSWGPSNTQTLNNRPEGIYGGFILIVIRGGYNNDTVHQIILTSTSGGFFWRKRVNVSDPTTSFIYWDVVPSRSATYKVYGTTAERIAPTIGGSRSVVGEQYFDTTLGKPIWWTGDTSDGKSGWVDATGANMPNASAE